MIQIDMEMPDNCQECRFLFDTLESGTAYYYCFGCGEPINQEDICITRRPDWCPLKEVDDKQEIIIPEGYKPWRLGEES